MENNEAASTVWKNFRTLVKTFLQNDKKSRAVQEERITVCTTTNNEQEQQLITKVLHELPTDMNCKRILLVSYYCPSRAHAGGLRILDIYSLIKAYFPDVIIDLFTYKRPEIDWSYYDIEQIFNHVYFSSVENLSPGAFSSLCKNYLRYDVIDLQFHQSAYNMDQWRAFGVNSLTLWNLVKSLANNIIKFIETIFLFT